MSWTYGNDPKNDDVDAVRFMCGLTDPHDQIVTDEEIDWTISQNDSLTIAAAAVCQAVSTRFSRQADIEVGDYSEKLSQRSENFANRARELRDEVPDSEDVAPPSVGGISQDDKEGVEDDSDRVEPKFTRQMHEFDQE